MKKLGLSLLMIICGTMGAINALGTIVGLTCLDIGVTLFYGIPAAIFIFITKKLAAKIKVMKAEAPKEKVKVEKEKPVNDNVVNLKDFKEEKEEPKKEKVKFGDKIVAKLEKWNEKLDKKLKEENNKDPKDNALIWKILDTIGCILLPILFIAAIIGLVIGAGALIVWLFNVIIGVIGAIIGFIFNAALYVIGFILFLVIAGGFLSFWWDLVKWEHVDKKRVYRRMYRNRRRW